jgi:hypothetical protein
MRRRFLTAGVSLLSLAVAGGSRAQQTGGEQVDPPPRMKASPYLSRHR